MLSMKVCRDLSKCLVTVARCSMLQSRLPTWGPTTIRRSYGDHSGTVGGGRNGGKGNDDDDDGFVKPSNYKVFKDDDSSVILDVEEERALLDSQSSADDTRSDFEEIDQFAGFDVSRGVSGVFEVEHLVEVLQKNNASDVFVVTVPTNVRYVDYIVIATGRSQKHLKSIADFVHKLFKKKRRPSDSIPRLVNKKPIDWIALDIGNIAVHLLTKDARKNFDLETIWSVGEKFDSHLNRPVDSLVSLLNEHSFSLDNLEPVDFEHVKTH
ncbi:mitochondrial assembly of ribosomal large subunit protein 1-like isoform X1 [Rhopalosiphum padi]|uniref:mitochondrial assembly of ribosomal large subunit protein 1-like isoform X1 n=1 Tax=Rhopalosiphum padi TaxID=40932 RepID=UPI00298DEC0F|nr:mitochondrial assembly of ribosomal large subunit protein 1-like isoform X1 [Rhopalosiphum padi]